MSEKIAKKKSSKNKALSKKKSNILRKNIKIEEFKAVRDLFESRLADTSNKEFKIQKNTIKIDNLDTEDVLKRINIVIENIINQILNNKSPSFDIPLRTAKNIIYDDIQDILLLGELTSRKSLLTLTSAQDATRLMKVLQIVYELLKKKKHMTKREVFYGDVNLFEDQKFSDSSIENVSTLLKTTRNSTGIVAKARGSAVGRLKLRDGSEIIELDAQGSGAWLITPMIDKIDVIESDAEFILVVEKDAAMMRIIEEKWWTKYPCIALTAEGVGNVATRMFLKKINKELRLPTFCLVDCDPYGHYIYSVYIRGSKRLSYESPFLATPEMHLLGVLTKDLDEYKIEQQSRIPMTKNDIKRLDDMLKEEFVKNNKRWKNDLELMKKIKMKAEIQALSSHGIEYLTDVYLPNKLYSGDWI
jgi:meiotic recombination protein SPO11